MHNYNMKRVMEIGSNILILSNTKPNALLQKAFLY